MKAIILAGGGGTRLWPVSRKKDPKQIKPLVGSDTLLQKTYKRVNKGFRKSDIFISTNIKYKQAIKKQLKSFPDRNLILEPEKKDTAAAIGLAAVSLFHKNPKSIMVTVNSDAYIKDEKEYLRILKLAEKVVQKKPGSTVLIGINPTYPETGYGYIKLGSRDIKLGEDEIFKAEKFVEKPDFKKAKEYLSKWDYLWNPAMFVWRVDTLLNLYKKYLPSIYKSLMSIEASLGKKNSAEVIKEEFEKIKPISIDYGIMEKIQDKMLVIPADFGWADVGHWRTVKDVLSKKESDNVVKGKYIGIESEGNLVYSFSGKLVATCGINDMIIIETEDSILVCPRDRAQDVKKIVQMLEEKNLNEYL